MFAFSLKKLTNTRFISEIGRGLLIAYCRRMGFRSEKIEDCHIEYKYNKDESLQGFLENAKSSLRLTPKGLIFIGHDDDNYGLGDIFPQATSCYVKFNNNSSGMLARHQNKFTANPYFHYYLEKLSASDLRETIINFYRHIGNDSIMLVCQAAGKEMTISEGVEPILDNCRVIIFKTNLVEIDISQVSELIDYYIQRGFRLSSVYGGRYGHYWQMDGYFTQIDLVFVDGDCFL